MKKLPLTRGLFAQVDDEDFSKVSRHKYRAVWNGSQWYAMRNSSRTLGPRRGIYLSREILDAPDHLEVHHIDGDPLNNRRKNLELRTPKQNRRGFARKATGTTSRFRGVRQNRGKWEANIQPVGGREYLGIFSSEESAARAYDAAAKRLFGEFAQLNFPT
jgi:hypothetical protein